MANIKKANPVVEQELQKNPTSELQENSKLAVKSVLWYTIGNVLLKGIAFISTPIFTRLLTRNDFGAFNNIRPFIAERFQDGYHRKGIHF